MEGLLDNFLDYMLKEKTLSKSTYQSYRHNIKEFLNSFLRDNDIFNADKEVIEQYLNCLSKSGKSNMTVVCNLASIRMFYNYLIRKGYTQNDPTLFVKAPKVERKTPQILTAKEVDAFLRQPKCTDLKGYRDKAMLELLYATGIRATELINLDLSDVDLEKAHLKIRGAARTMPISVGAMRALEDYLNNSRSLMTKGDDESALFVNYTGGRMTRQGFWKIVKTYKEQAKIKKELTPHTLRHSFAAHLLAMGADLLSVKEAMGYADISSTQVYAQIIETNMKNAYKRSKSKVL